MQSCLPHAGTHLGADQRVKSAGAAAEGLALIAIKGTEIPQGVRDARSPAPRPRAGSRGGLPEDARGIRPKAPQLGSEQPLEGRFGELFHGILSILGLLLESSGRHVSLP